MAYPTGMLLPRTWSLVLALLSLSVACKDDEGDDGPSDPSGPSDPDPMDPPSSWMVGEDGAMLRTNVEGEVSTYPLDHAGDLDAIACHGRATAWVVGEAAAVLLTRDAGEHWTPVDVGLPPAAHLRGVATAEGQAEGSETLVIAGDAGVLLRSTDGGSRFSAVEGPAVDWAAVATDEHGAVAFVAGADGTLWRSDGGAPLSRVYAGEGLALHDVAVSHDGAVVVAVGEDGLVLRSDDGGTRFEALAPATELDLHGVRLGADHATVVAVGEAGVVVRIDATGSHVQALLGPDEALMAVHLRADGLGQAVGTGGTIFVTHDAGMGWEPLHGARTSDLLGVDDFHDAPHY
jgi:photosystem II stability/assembly factor-like uncharacterized protein